MLEPYQTFQEDPLRTRPVLEWVLAALVGVLAATTWLFYAAWRRATKRARTLDSAKRSQSTRYGQITEQFAPLLADWPWDPKRFKFLGDPIDGIQFTDQGIILVEIKSAGSRLSTIQRQVRDHVRAGRVAWQEVRIG